MILEARRMARTCCRLLLAAVLAASAVAQAAPRALVITMAGEASSALPGVVRDEANALAILLAMGVPAERTRVAHGATATLTGLRSAIAQLAAETGGSDRVVVYFSGQGTRTVVDGRCEQALLTADDQILSAGALRALLDPLRARADTLDLIIDAAFAPAPAAAQLSPGSGRRVKFSDRHPDAACASPLTLAGVSDTRQTSRSTVNLDREDVVLFAARDDEAAFDDAANGGVATSALRECIQGSAGSATLSFNGWMACAQRRLDAGTSRQHLALLGPGDRSLPVATAATAAPSDSPVAEAVQGRRVALVIGNGKYPRAPLANPTHDARDFGSRLKALGFDVISRENVTAREFGGLLADFRTRLSGASVGLFFYAGHGLQVRGENYLPGVDEQIRTEEDVPSQSLPVRQVIEVLEGAKVPLGLLFLDACRNNPFARSTRSASQGLSRVEAAAGMLISFATRPGSVASDGDNKQNGLYTGELLAAIESAGDQPVELMLKRVAAGVRVASKGQQDPWIEGSLIGDFCFRGCGGASAATGPATPTALSSAIQNGLPNPIGKAQSPASAPPSLLVGRVAASSPPAPLAALADPRARPLALSRPVQGDILFVHGDTPNATGRIYLAVGGRAEERFTRPSEGNRGINAAVMTASGDLYFCDGTETRIMRLRAGHVEPIYRHDSFVRHLALDDRGRLHFSSTQGPRTDGVIYRLDGKQVSLVAKVNPATLGGSWSGTFAFDRQGGLWLSSGESTPSGLYRVDQGQPQRVFETSEYAIMGFAFLPDGSIVFANNQRSVLQLRLPGVPAKLFDSPFEGRLRAVFVLDRRPA